MCCIIAGIVACSNTAYISQPVSCTFHPQTPPLDSLLDLCTIHIDSIHRIPRSSEQGGSDYYRNGVPYNGWACSIDSTNRHMYRISNIQKGKLVRQIGYFSNGQVDHDFKATNGLGIGSNRMWMEDGHIYVQYYYSSPGVKHDTSVRYYKNHQIALLEVYDSGRLLQKTEWDTSGIKQN